MKRSIVLVTLVAVLAAACGASEEAAAPETTTAQATTTTTVAPTTTTASTTLPPTTTTSAADGIEASPVVPGEDQDVDDIVEAYLVVFDSATTFEEKSPFITDPTGLEETVENYTAAGDDVGGIALQADRVGVDGNEARVIYSFPFAGNAAYSDLEGESVLTDAGWQISREFFCEIMVLARVGCS
jgi:ABC-type transport system substrate-binding protein